MKRIFAFLLTFFWVILAFSQSHDLSGTVLSAVNVENIHVINKTQQLFTTTNARGEFTISVKVHDTLVFSSIQHKPQNVVVSESVFKNKTLVVTLEEQINVLDEVTVGKTLTGDLLADIKNTTGEAPINFYDVGIPGYTGKVATQSERRLSQANGEGVAFKTIMLQVLSLNVPVEPILNAISGRTKVLKQHVALEQKSELLHDIKVKFSTMFFELHPLDEDKQNEFFHFCEEDDRFVAICTSNNDLEILQFLEKKYEKYLENLNN
ncbi:hypothetical protein JJL45_06725 [Tamlana sp. s12]|uniref:hypothetical protein n=1 Tax=Tamlana sp. s12 TaxID=1630406 RepID=UPI0007FC7881|nr:hypothetical protein [Tamlana sp. s12]OBQ55835.1 hypothetical protein VQ01_05365 [Tamlana sp. s12]QQY83677.1 hypothetical protein JJL45_06725 [Tamlana sp. s12]